MRVRVLALYGSLLLTAAACSKERGGGEPPALKSASASAPANAPKPTAPAPSSNARKAPPAIDGAPLYEKYCALCHGKDAKGYVADNAPSLVSEKFLESASDAFIARGIRMGRPGTAMAAYAKRLGGPLEEPEIRAIVKFLRAKGPTAKPLPHVRATGDAKRGARSYAKHCASCHGTETQRGKAPVLFNPEFLSAATPAFLRYAIENGRPPTEMLPFAKVLSETDIGDVVTFLHSKAPGYRPPDPAVDVEQLRKLPVVMNPKGGKPTFTLRDNRFVSIDQVKKAFDAKARMVIVDARAASDFVSSHVPGAISNPYYDKASLDRIPNDGTWVIAYCACPHHASGEVVDELKRRGYRNLAVLDEGILEWQRRGYPVEGRSKQRPPAPPPK